MNRVRAAVVGALLAATLAGCSALSGRTEKDANGTFSVRPSGSTSSASSTSAAQFADAETVRSVLAAAKDDFGAIYTYDYHNVSKYERLGENASTTPFRTTYREAFSKAFRNQLKSTRAVQTGAADLVGIAGLDRHRKIAVVLVRGQLASSSLALRNPSTKRITDVMHLRLVKSRWVVSSVDNGANAQGDLPGNAEMHAAAAAARAGTTTLFGLRRAHFAGDFALALARTTGNLHSSLQTKRQQLERTLTDGHYDLSSQIRGLAAVQAAGTTAEFLVSVDEYRVGSEGARTGPYPSMYDLTMSLVGTTWLLSEATALS